MVGEVVLLAVLEDEETVRLQQVVLEDQVGYLRQLLQGIGWVGEDHVELLAARFEKAEHIAADQQIVVHLEVVHTCLDPPCVVAVHLHACDRCAAA